MVAGGYSQEFDVDYMETYAPTMYLPGYKMNEAQALDDPDAIREEFDLSGAYYETHPDFLQHMEQPRGFGDTPESYKLIDLDFLELPDFSPV